VDLWLKTLEPDKKIELGLVQSSWPPTAQCFVVGVTARWCVATFVENGRDRGCLQSYGGSLTPGGQCPAIT